MQLVAPAHLTAGICRHRLKHDLCQRTRAVPGVATLCRGPRPPRDLRPG